MKDYVFITDSTVDLPNEIAEEMGLIVTHLKFSINGVDYVNYLDERDIKSHDFYEEIRKGFMPVTSQVNVNDYLEIMRPYLEKGIDIFGFCFDSKLSGTYNSFCLAKNILLEEFPDSKIVAFDSLSACTGEGLFAYCLAKKKKEGLTIDELEKWAQDNYKKMNHWFTVDDIDHLKRGGRLTNSSAFVAKLLKIKPFMVCNNLGQLVVYKKAIGRKSAINMLYEKFCLNYDEELKERIFVSHADCYEEAKYLADKIENESGLKHGEVTITNIGPVIGAHTGPGCLAVFFVGKFDNREN